MTSEDISFWYMRLPGASFHASSVPSVTKFSVMAVTHGTGMQHHAARGVDVGGHLTVSALLLHDFYLLTVVVVAVHGDQPVAAQIGHIGCECDAGCSVQS